ncbi:hypothetical protein METBIDRAFT_31580 [Metschnikowia bicuspidata var. bicuspidata NRRL YB-4993]|uniref:Uncharacterized protein n=1 Tax=Metschnikowia bicuspidata var. bicuspidata NRRL YB-4993 TaxID=869754 RepID=A0A1A0HAM3_9ASCO|nr:hypothetical protein METBIDRAFT_31580 [Metschnikowia bicuspidata var. bicuspidata NRRL YB-4993]OBA20928.1 hypothetical protein METBIDRAFT_31580 [Metschnikowia bicuspidata var. bicuspidata NRRL YB-4993]
MGAYATAWPCTVHQAVCSRAQSRAVSSTTWPCLLHHGRVFYNMAVYSMTFLSMTIYNSRVFGGMGAGDSSTLISSRIRFKILAPSRWQVQVRVVASLSPPESTVSGRAVSAPHMLGRPAGMLALADLWWVQMAGPLRKRAAVQKEPRLGHTFCPFCAFCPFRPFCPFCPFPLEALGWCARLLLPYYMRQHCSAHRRAPKKQATNSKRLVVRGPTLLGSEKMAFRKYQHIPGGFRKQPPALRTKIHLVLNTSSVIPAIRTSTLVCSSNIRPKLSPNPAR